MLLKSFRLIIIIPSGGRGRRRTSESECGVGRAGFGVDV